jgi:hypothetical protein
MAALVRARSNCKQQTHPFFSHSIPHQQALNCPTVIKICLYAPNRCLIPDKQANCTSVGLRLSKTHLKSHKRLYSVVYSPKWRISITCYKAKHIHKRETHLLVREDVT